MPICTTCTNPTRHLYTVYQSAYNLRLEQCTTCHEFADPYVEHDSLTLVIDLILLKRGVYRHLLYNLWAEPRRAGVRSAGIDETDKGVGADEMPSRDKNYGGVDKQMMEGKEERLSRWEKLRWLLILRLGGVLVCVDAFIRWSYLNPHQDTDISPWSRETGEALIRTFIGCLVETVAFHAGIIAASFVVLTCLDRIRRLLKARNDTLAPSGIRDEFRFSLIPLSLLYSSLTKLFLLILLSIWRPSSESNTAAGGTPVPQNGSTWSGDLITAALQLLDDDKLDREWVVRNVLGGMSAGFGLRVILDCHPIFTTVIIVSGWAVKTAAAKLVSGWVGGDVESGEAWLAYSIP